MYSEKAKRRRERYGFVGTLEALHDKGMSGGRGDWRRVSVRSLGIEWGG